MSKVEAKAISTMQWAYDVENFLKYVNIDDSPGASPFMKSQSQPNLGL